MLGLGFRVSDLGSCAKFRAEGSRASSPGILGLHQFRVCVSGCRNRPWL